MIALHLRLFLRTYGKTILPMKRRILFLILFGDVFDTKVLYQRIIVDVATSYQVCIVEVKESTLPCQGHDVRDTMSGTRWSRYRSQIVVSDRYLLTFCNIEYRVCVIIRYIMSWEILYKYI